ncbi:myb-binding protein 1A-like protein isoform X2 [Denticeps clupeoides]|uniref:myb-binding protein 1A-like protein isoform X2 n=1 Tax=Denticeps clupeoides TaxID=299321 RepID=UPI0010A42206|nr:myb-binding protein 1A isoform X2 [Denticeps clupeoides]
MAVTLHEDMDEVEKEPVRPKVTDSKGILQKNREFLDFFWDIAKPEREIRLKAIEGLIAYLKKIDKSDELKYALQRLVDGLAHGREAARCGYSVALAQLLSVFEDIGLQTILDQIKGKHNLQTVNKKQVRNVAFGNFFGVLALSQSTRLAKEPQVLLECVRLLQKISLYREHLQDLPRKTMVDLLSETPQEVFEEVLLGALQTDLTAALSSPEHLELLLVAMQKFPDVLKPKKLKKLLGSTSVINSENIPKLVQVLKMAAQSMKKERLLPAVAGDLLQLSLREGSFQLFWSEAVINGLLKDQTGPSHYLCFRLLGSALPHLSTEQLQNVLTGEVMKQYGEHVLSAQLPDRFKFTPEMDEYVSAFLQGCPDSDRQLAVVVGFSLLTNQGHPVIPTHWKVVEFLGPEALKSYVGWLKDMFLEPKMEVCLDFVTRRQKEKQESEAVNVERIFRLRKWIVPRLTSIVDNNQVKKDEDLVMDIARFIFCHAFFVIKKKSTDIPETENVPSVPLDEKSRAVVVNAFFGLLHHLNHLPVLGEPTKVETLNKKPVLGVKADGCMWLSSLVQYADLLLGKPKCLQCHLSFTPEQRKAWDGMIQSVEALQKKAKKSQSPEVSAFQQLFLLVGMNLFKSPQESVELIHDIQSCVAKVQAKKARKKKASKDDGEEPHWVEVLVEILLSLLSQPSRLIRSICKTVFSRVCPHVTQNAISAILDVLDPTKDSEESGVVVTDEKDEPRKEKGKEEATAKGEDQEEDGDESDSSDDDEEEDEAMEDEVDPNFRLELMKVLQGSGAVATEEDNSDDEELDDEAMMKLDSSIASLFAEQKKKIQAKKEEKERLRKEKTLVRDFKIKVLDLVEIFLLRQSTSPLVLGMIEPLLAVIESGMSSETEQQEQDFLRKAADIFRNQLCRGKQYCKNVEDRQAELHDMLEKLLSRAQKLSDSSISLFYFSASLYLLKVLRGGVQAQTDSGDTSEEGKTAEIVEVGGMGNVDVERVTARYTDALVSFMTRRNSPLTGAMFMDLFSRFPTLCKNLLDTAVEYITGGAREHQQGQACAVVLKGLQSNEVQKMVAGDRWTGICQTTVDKVTETLGKGFEVKNKMILEKMTKALELSLFLVKTIHHQNLAVDLQPLRNTLQSLNKNEAFQKSGHMEDTYWGVMKMFGVQKPKLVKMKKAEEEVEKGPTTKAKKKGFLPETKKRKHSKKPVVLEEKIVGEKGKPAASPAPAGDGEQGKKKKRKRNKNRKRKHSEGAEAPAQSPAKKTKKKAAKQGAAKS